jgi:hypothetical protein
MVKTFFTFDNGGRPFKVVLSHYIYSNTSTDKTHIYKISIYKQIINSFNSYKEQPLLDVSYSQIFIGKSKRSKLTQYTRGFGNSFRGNTILFKESSSNTTNLEYTFVGDCIYKFTALDEIVKYESPVGNNGVSYPSAMDKSGNIYLFVENVVITNLKNRKKLVNIYDYYYSKQYLKQYIVIANRYPSVLDIQNDVFNLYSLNFKVDSAKYYDSLIDTEDNKIYFMNGIKWRNSRTRIPDEELNAVDNKISFKEYRRENFIEMMEEYGLKNGFHSFKNKIMIETKIY